MPLNHTHTHTPTNLILTVISAALQGILKQSASGGEGVDVEVDEGV